MSDDPTDRQLDAGEYVLGVLTEAEVFDIRARALAEPELAAAIAGWQARLAPLANAATPVAPPDDLWRRIAAGTILTIAPGIEITGAAARSRRQLRIWRTISAGCVALAAAFAGIAYVAQQPADRRFAVLSTPNVPGPAFIVSASGGGLEIRPLVNVATPSDRDLELWSLPAGATRPASLGVLPATGRRIALADLPADKTQLLVSLEPRGGSPTGQPTGAVLYAGTWTRLE